MRMTCKVQFDPLQVAPKEIMEALGQFSTKVEITFHNTRETAETKTPKPGAVSSRS